MKILIYLNRNKDIRNRREKVAREVRENIGKDIIEVLEVNQRERSIDRIRESDSIIFFAHGGEDKIFHDYSDTNKEVLIDNSNISILKDKKVIAFCCFTARKLGQNAITEGCKCYIGFLNSINRHLLEGISTPSQIMDFLNTTNNNAFKKILIEAINENKKMEVISRSLKHEIRASAVRNIGEYNNKNFREYIPQIMLAVGDTADGICCYGNGEAQLR